MGCGCSNNHHLPRYTNLTNLPVNQWDDAEYILGQDSCGNIVVLAKPLYEISEEDRKNLDALISDGDGELFLSDDGTYHKLQLTDVEGLETSGDGDLMLSDDGTYKAVDRRTPSIVLAYNEQPANFVIRNMEQLAEIRSLVELSYEPVVRLDMNGVVLPVQVEYAPEHIRFFFDSIMNEVPEGDMTDNSTPDKLKRFSINIVLSRDEVPVIEKYEFTVYNDASAFLQHAGNGKKALFNNGTYKPVYTKEETDRKVSDELGGYYTKEQVDGKLQEVETSIDNVREYVDGQVVEVNDTIRNVQSELEEKIETVDNRITEVNNAIDEKLEDAVFYNDNNDIQARNNIILGNDRKILGTDTEGIQYNLVQLSRWNIIDVGSGSGHLNLNSALRPTVQLKGETGAQAHAVAFVEDVEDAQERMDDLREEFNEHLDEFDAFKDTVESAAQTAKGAIKNLDKRVTVNETNIEKNRVDILGIRQDLAETEHFRGYFETTDQVTAIDNPQNGDYAWNAESGTVWAYNGTTWANTGVAVPDQTVEAYTGTPVMDGVADAGASNQYSRGDHCHPTDISRAAASDLDNYLPLAGNTQDTKMSGDIWLGSGNNIYVTDSGNSYLKQEVNTQTTVLNGDGVGGIDLNAGLGKVKYNGEEVAVVTQFDDYYTKPQTDQAIDDAVDAVSQEVTESVEKLENQIKQVEEDLSAHEVEYEALKEKVDSSLDTVNESIDDLEGRVVVNEGNIEKNRVDILGIRQDLADTEHFRGYYETNAQLTAIATPRSGDYAWSAESGTVWTYNGITWADTTVAVPDQNVDAYAGSPVMDGIADAGASNQYSRGDHCHPTDTTRAAVSDLDDYLPLAGNSQSTKMSGDIWLGGGNNIYVNDSGESYLKQVVNSQTVVLNGDGVGGIDLTSGLGKVKYNGEEVAVVTQFDDYYTKPQTDEAIRTAVDTISVEVTEDLNELKTQIKQVEEDLSEHEGEYEALKEKVDASVDAVNESIDGLEERVTVNEGNIEKNRVDILGIRQDLADTEHFRGYYETNAQLTAIDTPRLGDYAWSAESGTVWTYNGITWADTTVAVPDQNVDAYAGSPVMDGIADAGASNQYSRGDHCHPTDTTRAAVSDLDDYLPLAGNSQSNKMSGDIWLGSENNIYVNDSGKSYLKHETDTQTVVLNGDAVGGIDLTSQLGKVKYNGTEVAVVTQFDDYYTKPQTDEAIREAVEGFSVDLSEEVENLQNKIKEVENGLSEHEGEYEVLKEKVDTSLDAVNESIDGLEERVTANEGNIEKNRVDILGIRQDLADTEHFRGYYETTAQVTAISNPREGDYAWSAESKTVWTYNGTTWADSAVPLPDQNVEAYTGSPVMDGIADAGASNQYSRGDHCHPTDTSRAAVSDLDNYLSLSGNTQATKMSGDIWLGSENSIYVNESGKSFLKHEVDTQTVVLNGDAVGGIDLTSQLGKVKYNGTEVAVVTQFDDYYTKPETDEAIRTEVEYLSVRVTEDVDTLQAKINIVESELSDHVDAYDAFKETVDATIESVNGSIDDLEGRVIVNEGNIEKNRVDILGIRQDLADTEHFRGYYETTDQVTAIPNPREGDYAWSAESGTVWTYNGTTWANSGVAIPDQTVEAYTGSPVMDGIADAGASNQYSRGDHCHPTDTSRAAAADLDNYLPLAGNTRNTKMSGDIWLGTGNNIYVTDNGNSFIGQDTNSQTTVINGDGAGGINLVSEWGIVKYNDVEVAVVTDFDNYYTKHEAEEAIREAIDNVENDLSGLENAIAALEQKDAEINTRIDGVDDTIQEVKDTYLPLTGGTVSGELVMEDANITIDQEHYIGFFGDGRVRIGYNTAAQELRIVTTATDNGIDVVTNPSYPTSTFRYNGEEVATKVDLYQTDTQVFEGTLTDTNIIFLPEVPKTVISLFFERVMLYSDEFMIDGSGIILTTDQLDYSGENRVRVAYTVKQGR